MEKKRRFDEGAESVGRVRSQVAKSGGKNREMSSELVHGTCFTYTLALKSLQPFRHLPLLLMLILPPTRSWTFPLSKVRLLSASLHWHYNPPLSLLPLHYVIMIIAHRGLRKLNFPFCSGSFIPPVSLCATSPSPPQFSTGRESAAWTFDQIYL